MSVVDLIVVISGIVTTIVGIQAIVSWFPRHKAHMENDPQRYSSSTLNVDSSQASTTFTHAQTISKVAVIDRIAISKQEFSLKAHHQLLAILGLITLVFFAGIMIATTPLSVLDILIVFISMIAISCISIAIGFITGKTTGSLIAITKASLYGGGIAIAVSVIPLYLGYFIIPNTAIHQKTDYGFLADLILSIIITIIVPGLEVFGLIFCTGLITWLTSNLWKRTHSEDPKSTIS